jgi:hypothetical protein
VERLPGGGRFFFFFGVAERVLIETFAGMAGAKAPLFSQAFGGPARAVPWLQSPIDFHCVRAGGCYALSCVFEGRR